MGRRKGEVEKIYRDKKTYLIRKRKNLLKPWVSGTISMISIELQFHDIGHALFP